MELDHWRKHIAQEVSDRGLWIGIADEEGYPIMDALPVISASLPQQRLAFADASVTVATPPGSPLLNQLVATGLGNVDKEGRLVPASGLARFLVTERAGIRTAATIVPSVATGGQQVQQVEIKAIEATEILSWWPCPSIPVEWKPDFKDFTTDASGVVYASPRKLAQVPMATKADGYTMKGRARDTIRALIQDSFDAVNALMGWDVPHAVVDFDESADTSPEVMIRVTDDYVWDTIAEPARAAGVLIKVDLWWPGDQPVRTRATRSPAAFEPKTFAHPMWVVRVITGKEVA